VARPGPEIWRSRLDAWLEPFLAALPRAEQRRWAPLYVQGLLLPGERKSVEPMAARVCPGQVQQLHHFVSASTWPHERLERVLAEQADRLVGGPDAVLVVDDTALVKQGRHSAGVQRQYCGQLGKRANCQALVSLTLARGEVPIPVALRLFLPDAWVKDAERRRAARVPDAVEGRTKWRIALDEIARLRAQGVRFGCVLGDAEYGKVAAFRHALDDAGLRWALGIPPNQKVFSTSVTTALPPRKPRGRAPKHPVPSEPSAPVSSLFANPPDAAFQTVSWRTGTKGPLRAAFAAKRVRVADGPEAAGAQHLPGEERWLVCEHRTTGERKFHLANHPADATLEQLAAALKGRWSCEQAHQQLKEELGLDHYEGRSWPGLHHHALLCQIAHAFLQSQRVGGEKARIQQARHPRPATPPDAARGAPLRRRGAAAPPHMLPSVRSPHPMAHANLNLAE